ncbi:MAG: hypothetical protein KQ78_00421 [Candidatus Izimaplasma bacterium HR2]|nr:MAG: hypothetical protein KQ78_00421 [Candidatus Izimaplasma bacterium HR2]
MKKSKFEERITTSFKTETPDILDKIKSSDQFYIPNKVKKYDFSRFFNKRLSYSLASVFVLALVLFSILSSGTEVPAVVASTVTLDINPSVQITLDDDDNVINITAINSDGELLIDRDIKFKGLSLDRAIELIMAEAVKRGFIIDGDEDNIILIDVSSDREDVKARVEAALELKISEEMERASKLYKIVRQNRDDLTVDQVNRINNIAEENNISVAKLLLINRIIQSDDSYTIETLKDYSIRRLYSILIEVNPLDDSLPGNNDAPGLDDIPEFDDIPGTDNLPGNNDNPGNN